MKIQQFNGGLATRLQPHFLALNQGAAYQNINNSVGSLTPVAGGTLTEIEVFKFHEFYIAKQEWISAVILRDYVEYNNVMYWTDRVSQPQKYDGDAQTSIGIEAPTQLTDITASVLDTVVSIILNADATGSLPSTIHEYALVNTDSALGTSNALIATIDDTIVETVGVDVKTLSGVVRVYHEEVQTQKVTISTPAGVTIGNQGIQVFRLYAGQYHRVGILYNNLDTVTDSNLDISANPVLNNSSFANMQGVYQYQMTYYNKTLGVESGPCLLSAEQDLSRGGTVDFLNLPVSVDPQVTHKRLYRIGGDLSVSTLVAEIDNATTSYHDDEKDTDLVGTLLDTVAAAPAPIGLSFLTEAYAMLFGAIGNKLRFTPIANPDSWPELYYLTFTEDITGIAAVTNGLLVFTAFNTHLVTGTGPTSLSQRLLSADQGCKSFSSVQVISGAALWVSSDGICTSSGSRVIVISKDALGKQDLTITDAAIHDEVYYALEASGSMICYDFAYGQIFKRLQLGNEGVSVANDTLYGWYDGFLHKLFDSEAKTTMLYKSPRLTEGSMTSPKTYKNVRVYHKGPVTVSILIDDLVVSTANLVGEDSKTIKIPQLQQRGFFIQFEVTGEGEVYEIEYITGASHNA